MQNRKGLALVLAFVVALSAAGCGQKAAPAEKAPLVKTQQAGSGMEADTGTYAGTVRGRYETNLAFQVGGQILARNVQEGSRVRAGDTLMVINAKDVVQQSNAGDAQVAQARAQLDLAQRNLARYSELYQEDAVAASVLDQYQANYDAAFATYQQALATAAQGHNALGYTNLTAGADGVISKITAEEGQVVAAGQTVMTLVQSLRWRSPSRRTTSMMWQSARRSKFRSGRSLRKWTARCAKLRRWRTALRVPTKCASPFRTRRRACSSA